MRTAPGVSLLMHTILSVFLEWTCDKEALVGVHALFEGIELVSKDVPGCGRLGGAVMVGLSAMPDTDLQALHFFSEDERDLLKVLVGMWRVGSKGVGEGGYLKSDTMFEAMLKVVLAENPEQTGSEHKEFARFADEQRSKCTELCASCQAAPNPGAKLRFCAACRLVGYCDKACQKADWNARHKYACSGKKKRGDGAKGALSE